MRHKNTDAELHDVERYLLSIGEVHGPLTPEPQLTLARTSVAPGNTGGYHNQILSESSTSPTRKGGCIIQHTD
jgi:hypothetical protein